MTFRAFVSLDIGALPRVEAFSRALREAGGQLSLVDPAILHTTLKFLGETRKDLVPGVVAVMERAVAAERASDAVLRRTGAFPDRNRMRVVWVGIDGAEALGRIAAFLDRELEPLGFRPERRRWEPHVTVARVKGGRNLDRVRAALDAFAEEDFGTVRIDRIRLKRSVLTPQGPRYGTEAEVALPA